MKKRVLLVMGICILMLAGGCSKKGVADDLGTGDQNSSNEEGDTEVKELPKVEDYVASDYITLGQYKGIEVTVEQLEVTDEDIDDAIQSDLASNATQEEVTGRAVENGDTVNIDYEGLLDGVAFEGGTAQGANLDIGSGSFIDGFEEGLIGKNIGDKVALNLTFPEDYYNTEMAGKEVVFNVTVNSIKKSVLPELNDAYVTDNTDYDTVDAYKENIRTELETSNQSSMDNEKAGNVMTAVLDASTIKELPQTLIDYYTAQIQYSFEYEASAYGMDIETYVSNFNMTMDEYNEYVNSMVDFYAKQHLILSAVIQAEGLEATQEEIDLAVTDYMGYYGVATKDELFETISEDDIKKDVVMQKAYDFILDNAVVTYAAAADGE